MKTHEANAGAHRVGVVRAATNFVVLAGCCIVVTLLAQMRSDSAASFSSAYAQQVDASTKGRGPEQRSYERERSVPVKALVAPGTNGTTRSAGPGSLATGFESAEGFAAGPIFGQVGWGAFQATPEGHIDTVNPAAGSQHLRISKDPSLATGTNTGAFSPDLGPLATGPSTTSVDIAISAIGGANYIVLGQSPSEAFLTWEVLFEFNGRIWVFDDIGAGAELINTGDDWTVGPYQNLTVCDDPIAGTTDYYYNGALIYSNVAHLGGTRVEQVILFSDNWQTADNGDFDNLSIQSGLEGICDQVVTLGDNDAFTTSSDKLWTIDISVGGQSLVGTAVDSKFMAGLSFRPDTGELYTVEEDDIRILNTANASVVWAGGHGVFILDTPAGIAFDAQSNLFLIHDETLYSVNETTGTATVIGPTGLDKGGSLAFGPHGKLYAIGEESSFNGAAGLVELNPLTGSIVQAIGPLSDPSDPGPFNQGSMGMDFSSRGVLYLINSGHSLLYRVSLVDATVTPVGSAPVTRGSLAIFRDCNGNGVHDSHDVTIGSSPDVNGDGLPDECPICGDGTCDTVEGPCICPEDCGGPAASEVVALTCNDGIDNDCDLDVDCDDADCAFEDVCLVPSAGGPGDLIMSGDNDDYIHRIDGLTGQHLHSFHAAVVLDKPRGIAIGSDGVLYVAGQSSRNVVRFHLPTGLFIDTFVQSEAGGLDAPQGIAFGPDQNLYVCDWGRDRVLRFDGTSGAYIDDFVAFGAGGLFQPWDLEFHSDGNLYVVSSGTHSVLRFDGTTGAFIDVFVPPMSGGLVAPRGIAFVDGSLLVSSSDTLGAVYRYAPATGSFVDVFVQPGDGGIRFPTDIAIGLDGHLYVAGDGANRITRFDGQTGALLNGFFYGPSGPEPLFFAFVDPECAIDSDCDDGDSATTDRCISHACTHQEDVVFFVDADSQAGVPDGKSWATAFGDLQAAMTAAEDLPRPMEFWVAEGVYRPDLGSGDRKAKFDILDGYLLYGGFDGTETSRKERNPVAHTTILSGDLAGNDGANFSNADENSYHVAVIEKGGLDFQTTIDGFTVTGGNATGPEWKEGDLDRGGGLLVSAASPTVSQCVFSANQGTLGGGLHLENGDRSLIVDCMFVGNKADSGAGVFVMTNDDAVFVNDVFSGNQAIKGAGLYVIESRVTATNCTFGGNIASDEAGGIFTTAVGINIANSILWGNADAGGMDELAQITSGGADIDYCCIQGWTGALGGTGNTGDCEPLYLDPDGPDDIAGTPDDDLRIPFQSSNFDAGDSDADTDEPVAGLQPLPELDFDGVPRVLNASVDRGAFELNICANVDVAGECNPGWEYNPTTSHCYRLTTSGPGSWTDAETEAANEGGHLVTINDETEQTWLNDTFPFKLGPLWIGLRQLPGSSEPDSGWEWISGEFVTYTNWHAGEPDEAPPGTNEDRAAMHALEPGHWIDVPDDTPSVGIIELDSIPTNDCNSNEIPDECEVSAGEPDCNSNGSPDSCDIAGGILVDANGNGVPDICENGTPLLPGMVDGVDHNIAKQRFLSINPNSTGVPTRMRLSLLDTACSVTGKQCIDDASCTACDAGSSNASDPCDKDTQCLGGLCVVSGETCEELSPPVVLGFILDPVQAGGDALLGTLIAAVDPVDPGFRVWDEPLVHIVDCEVAPGRVYRVGVETSALPGVFAELDIRTSPKPEGKDWGDIVGNFTGTVWTAGNLLVSVDDVSAIIKFLTLKPAPHVTRCEMLSAIGPTYVNMDVSADELGQIIRCFQGELFPPLPMVLGGYPDLQAGGLLTDCTGN